MAVIRGPACVNGWPITRLPPYGHTPNGNGGPSTGAGSPRYLGAGPLSAVPFQSSVYAWKNLLRNPFFAAVEEMTGTALPTASMSSVADSGSPIDSQCFRAN